MWCACACACARAVAWLAEGVNTKSKPTAAATITTMAKRILAILKVIRNRLLPGRGRVGPSRPELSSEDAARRVPSALNCSLRCGRRRGYRYYNERGTVAMPGTS